jgi:hypothetical protein
VDTVLDTTKLDNVPLPSAARIANSNNRFFSRPPPLPSPPVNPGQGKSISLLKSSIAGATGAARGEDESSSSSSYDEDEPREGKAGNGLYESIAATTTTLPPSPAPPVREEDHMPSVKPRDFKFKIDPLDSFSQRLPPPPDLPLEPTTALHGDDAMDLDQAISFKREADDPPSPLRAAALKYPEKHRRVRMPPLITQPTPAIETPPPPPLPPVDEKKPIAPNFSMERLVSVLFKKVVDAHGPLYTHPNQKKVNSHLERIRQLIMVGWTLGVESARGLANTSDGYKVPNNIIAALLDEDNMTGVPPVPPDWNALVSDRERIHAASKFSATMCNQVRLLESQTQWDKMNTAARWLAILPAARYWGIASYPGRLFNPIRSIDDDVVDEEEEAVVKDADTLAWNRDPDRHFDEAVIQCAVFQMPQDPHRAFFVTTASRPQTSKAQDILKQLSPIGFPPSRIFGVTPQPLPPPPSPSPSIPDDDVEHASIKTENEFAVPAKPIRGAKKGQKRKRDMIEEVVPTTTTTPSSPPPTKRARIENPSSSIAIGAWKRPVPLTSMFGGRALLALTPGLYATIDAAKTFWTGAFPQFLRNNAFMSISSPLLRKHRWFEELRTIVPGDMLRQWELGKQGADKKAWFSFKVACLFLRQFIVIREGARLKADAPTLGVDHLLGYTLQAIDGPDGTKALLRNPSATIVRSVTPPDQMDEDDTATAAAREQTHPHSATDGTVPEKDPTHYAVFDDPFVDAERFEAIVLSHCMRANVAWIEEFREQHAGFFFGLTHMPSIQDVLHVWSEFVSYYAMTIRVRQAKGLPQDQLEAASSIETSYFSAIMGQLYAAIFLPATAEPDTRGFSWHSYGF